MSQASIISQMTQLTVNQIMTMCEMECGPFKEGKRNKWSANAGQFIVYGLEELDTATLFFFRGYVSGVVDPFVAALT